MLEEIKTLIHDNIFCHCQQELAFNCFYFAFKTQEILRNELNIKSLLTLGSYSDKGVKLFYEPLMKLKYRLKNPNYKSNGINLHGWLTLPDYSVIDVTVLSAILTASNSSGLDYRNFLYFNALEQNDSNKGYSYHPKLLGVDYLKKVELNPYLTSIIVQ